MAFLCCNESAQSFAKPPKFLVLSLVLSPAGQIDQLLVYPRAAFDSDKGREILIYWLPLDSINFMHVRCCVSDLPIVFMDGSVPLFIVAIRVSAERFKGYILIVCRGR